jgi:hypothetical protein
MIIYQKWISRADLQLNPKVLYVFGDNCKRVGNGGQAKEMRGEINAFGIPTKWTPGHSEDDYFYDHQRKQILPIIDGHFRILETALQDGKLVIFPTDGIGTGLSKLPEQAPQIDADIKAFTEDLFERFGG